MAFLAREIKPVGRLTVITAAVPVTQIHVAVEVKRQKKNYKPDLLEKKVERLKHKILPHYMITKMCLSLEDMYHSLRF